MKIHRFIGDFNLSPDKLVLTEKEFVHQIRNVLKLHPKEHVILCDGQGHDALSIIQDIGKNSIEISIRERMANEAEPMSSVTLYCAILKRENFELVVQKAVEVGITRIVPIITARTVKTEVKIDRLQKIAKEAAEQSGRGRVPEVAVPLKFGTAVEQASGETANILFDAEGEHCIKPSNVDSHIWIGPEGGWTEEEIGLAKESGFKILSLGMQVLRGETAAIVASYLMCHGQ